MVNDAKFDVVSVTRSLYARNIEAESITLHDTTLRGDVHTSGRRVKELYEMQRNTNCFDDSHKSTVEDVQRNVTMTGQGMVTHGFCHLKSHAEVDDERMPDNTFTICLDDAGAPMYKFKIAGSVTYGGIATCTPRVEVDLGSIMTLSSARDRHSGAPS